jgi:hypothetical protein
MMLNRRTGSGSDLADTVYSTEGLTVISLLQVATQPQNRKRFYERAVKKKVSPRPPKVLGS